MTKTPEIVVSGSIAIDRIMSFNGLYSDHIHAEKLDKLSISIFLNELKDSYGGVAGNITYTLALLGDEPVLLGSVGPDGLVYMEHLAKQGVNIQHINESELSTATFNVITDGSQNQVGGFYPGAMFDSDRLSFEPWKDKEAIAVVSPHDPKAMRRQVKECKRWNLTLLYDVGQQVSNLTSEDLREGVEAADILILNEYELTALAKKTDLSVNDIKSEVPVVITTLGANGSLIEGKDVPQKISVGVVKPNKVLDPTGAGDAYRSGFLYGYSRNWPLKSCAQMGAACAVYAVETAGTQAHTLTFEDVVKRHNASFKERLLF